MSSDTLHTSAGQHDSGGTSSALNRTVAIASAITALGGLLFGYDTDRRVP